MEAQALEVQEVRPTELRLTADQIRSDVNLIQKVLKSVFQRDVHFGVVPGTQKPSLLKPGAEKIMATFRLNGEPMVEDLSSADEIRYRIKVRIKHQITGQELGWGIGECSSSETKYKWIKPVCKEEFDETPEDRRRNKWQKGYNGRPEKVMQIRPNLHDSANTILKMAKKRALIDAVLTVTAASDIFTQDIEDMPEELREAVVEAEESRVMPAQEVKADAPASEFTAKVATARSKFLSEYSVGPLLVDEHLKAKKLVEPSAIYAHLGQLWKDIKAGKTTLEKAFPGYKAPAIDAING